MYNKLFFNFSFLILLQTKAALIVGQIITRIQNRLTKLDDNSDDIRKKVLVLKTDEIGDFVLATVFLRELRLLLPRARITLVVNPATFNLAELCPYVDDIIIYRQKVPRYLRPFILPLRAFRLGFYTLQPEHFDMALLPRRDMDTDYSLYVAYFSLSRQRIGYTEHIDARKQLVNKGFDLMLTDVLFDKKPQHEVERYLDFIRYLGGNPSSDSTEVWLNAEDEEYADHLFADIPAKMVIAFCPGAGKANRQWPPDRFIELGQWLKMVYDSSFIIVGGPGDKPVGKYIKDGIDQQVIDFTGSTTLRQTFSLLKRCRLYVGNDTGSMHLAAAAGIPVVEISCFPDNGPIGHWNSPQRFGPWKVPNKILQPKKSFGDKSDPSAKEHLNHIHEISVAQVQRAIQDLFPEIIMTGT